MSTPPPVDIEDSLYNYVPSRTFGIVFVVLFALTTAAHLGQAVYHKSWWLLPTIALCGILETAGWAGRLWSSWDAFLVPPFQLQITLTIIAPTPLLAADFVLLGRLIGILGPVYGRMSPRWYSIVFVTADFIALVIQGVGGGLAASADTLEAANRGGNIMLGGIAFQLGMMIIFILCGLEFFVRYFWKKPIGHRVAKAQPPTGELTKDIKILMGGVALTTVLLLVRAVYRTIELTDGWDGEVISTESLFLALDATMVVIAMIVFNLTNPGRLLPRDNVAGAKDIENSGLSTPDYAPESKPETRRN